MAGSTSDDDFAAALEEVRRESVASALGSVRQADGALRNEQIRTWFAAADNLAEKAIAALDVGDEERADRLVRRIVALPVVDESTRSGLMAVTLLLNSEIVDPSFDDDDGRGLLELPLRLLPELDTWAADALRHALAVMTDYELPGAIVRRIRSVVPLSRRFDPPFAGVAEDDLPAAVTSVLRLVLRLRSEN